MKLGKVNRAAHPPPFLGDKCYNDYHKANNSTPMTDISGAILTKDNGRTIRACLRSLRGLARELIIVDDGSNDDTIPIIKEEWPEAKIYPRKLDRFDAQRNYAISLCSQPWILMIDSDELVSPELEKSILELETENDIDAYWTNRHNRFFQTYLLEDYWNRPILFENTARFVRPVHEILDTPMKKRRKLAGHLIHEDWESISRNMEKMDKYSSLIAKRWIEEDRNYGLTKLFLLALVLPIRHAFICFFQKRFYRAGFFTGVFYSLFESSWWLAVIFKYREIRDKEKEL